MKEAVTAAFPLVHFPVPHARPAVAGVPFEPAVSVNARAPRPMARRRDGEASLLDRYAALARPGVGLAAVVCLFAGVGLVGETQNGGYDAFVARNGEPWDVLARAAGLDVAAVTITGQQRLSERELLAASGVTTRNSLPFLDAAAVRERLLAVPLIKSARVMKLYPNRLVVAVEERRPHALWQRDGRVTVIAEDGVAIDELRDERYLGLPFVVGAGAEKRLPEFLQLLQGMGDLAPRVKAGVLVAGRRWDIEMTNGVILKIPEEIGRAHV
jgi:cell division protein FtsQ